MRDVDVVDETKLTADECVPYYAHAKWFHNRQTHSRDAERNKIEPEAERESNRFACCMQTNRGVMNGNILMLLGQL